MAKEPKIVCPYCLADPFRSSTTQNPRMRCPYCACAYNGSERKEEFECLEKAGLVIALRR